MTYTLREYMESNRSPFAEWFNRLDAVTAARVDRCMRRMEAGNFGDSKALKGGIHELRLAFGPGYRVYYGIEGKTLVILLGGGDKRKQSADIAAAVKRWERYQEGQ
jgi:putative addiction module killer protein